MSNREREREGIISARNHAKQHAPHLQDLINPRKKFQSQSDIHCLPTKYSR
jgi:hypothetical protein